MPTVNYYINNGNNDGTHVEECGEYNLSQLPLITIDEDLCLGKHSRGVHRFEGVEIPNGVIITDARLNIYNVSMLPFNTEIWFHLSGNSPTLQEQEYTPEFLYIKTYSFTWSTPAPTEQTVDVTSIVQDMVNQSGFAGNLAFIFEAGTYSDYHSSSIYTFDATQQSPMHLYIRYNGDQELHLDISESLHDGEIIRDGEAGQVNIRWHDTNSGVANIRLFEGNLCAYFYYSDVGLSETDVINEATLTWTFYTYLASELYIYNVLLPDIPAPGGEDEIAEQWYNNRCAYEDTSLYTNPINLQSPNLATAIQQIVNLPEWASGNAMTCVIEGQGTALSWAAYEWNTQFPDNPHPPAELQITYAGEEELITSVSGCKMSGLTILG